LFKCCSHQYYKTRKITFLFIVHNLNETPKFITYSIAVTNDASFNVVLKKRNSPADSLTADSTSQIDNTTTRNDVRTRGRQFVLRFESDDDLSPTARQKDFKWRLGATRLDVNPSGRR